MDKQIIATLKELRKFVFSNCPIVLLVKLIYQMADFIHGETNIERLKHSLEFFKSDLATVISVKLMVHLMG